MAGEWEDLTLGDLGRVVTGKTPLTAVEGNFGGQIPFVTPSDMDSRRTIFTTARYLTETGAASVKGSKIPAGSIMVSCIGSDMGKVVIAGRDCVTNQQINSIVVDDRFSSEFVYYSLSTRKNEIRHQAAGGSAVPILNKGDFSRMEITLPPLAEQKAIAAVLGALDDKVELNRRMNATLEAMARALFQSWFVDFNPVRAKLDGRQPAGMNKTTAALFPEHLEDTLLGHVPKGWEVSRLDEIASVMMGLSPDGESYNSEGTGKPLINGPVEFGDYFPVKTKWTEAATRFAAEGDLIFCVRGSTTGRRVVSDGEYGIGRGVCAIRAKNGCHNFLYQTINVGLDRMLEKTTGSVFPSLSAPDIKGFSVLRPSKAILEAYECATKPLLQRIQQNHHQSRTLATLRDTLLPKLLSGELSVAEVAPSPGNNL